MVVTSLGQIVPVSLDDHDVGTNCNIQEKDMAKPFAFVLRRGLSRCFTKASSDEWLEPKLYETMVQSLAWLLLSIQSIFLLGASALLASAVSTSGWASGTGYGSIACVHLAVHFPAILVNKMCGYNRPKLLSLISLLSWSTILALQPFVPQFYDKQSSPLADSTLLCALQLVGVSVAGLYSTMSSFSCNAELIAASFSSIASFALNGNKDINEGIKLALVLMWCLVVGVFSRQFEEYKTSVLQSPVKCLDGYDLEASRKTVRNGQSVDGTRLISTKEIPASSCYDILLQHVSCLSSVTVELDSSLLIERVLPASTAFVEWTVGVPLDILVTSDTQTLLQTCHSVLDSGIPEMIKLPLRLSPSVLQTQILIARNISEGLTLYVFVCEAEIASRLVSDVESSLFYSFSHSRQSTPAAAQAYGHQIGTSLAEAAIQTEITGDKCGKCLRPPALPSSREDFERAAVTRGRSRQRSRSRKGKVGRVSTVSDDVIQGYEKKARHFAATLQSNIGPTVLNGLWHADGPSEAWLSKLVIDGDVVHTASGSKLQFTWQDGLVFLNGGVMLLDGSSLLRYTEDGLGVRFQQALD